MDRNTTVLADMARANPKSQSCKIRQERTCVGLVTTNENVSAILKSQCIHSCNNKMYLYNRSLPDKNVLRFHIPVDDTVGMQVMQCFNLHEK
jgi:hypothetical protein